MNTRHTDTALRCPTCNSPDPHRHPAVQCEGEVHTCPDVFHGRFIGVSRRWNIGGSCARNACVAVYVVTDTERT